MSKKSVGIKYAIDHLELSVVATRKAIYMVEKKITSISNNIAIEEALSAIDCMPKIGKKKERKKKTHQERNANGGKRTKLIIFREN